MDFKGFYDEIIFDVDRPILKSYTGKQGDTKSRGLYVTVTQKNAVIDDLTGLSMRFFYEKPDKTRGFIDGVVDGSKFRIDYTNQMYAVPGVVKAELRLMGADGEIITAKTFKILVDSSIADGSIVSENERGILDRAFELAEDIIPRLELLDVELLEDVQDEMLGARHSGTKDATYDSLGQRLDASEQDLLDHKAEYTSNRQQDQLKIAKVEKELNDYKATMQQVNIHQSPTQKASGHGIVSLPPNAAEGQISVTIKGKTVTQMLKNGNFKNGTTDWAVQNATNFTVTNGIAQFTVTAQSGRLWQYVNVIQGHVYYITAWVKADSNLVFIDIAGVGKKYHSGSGNWERLSNKFIWSSTSGSFPFGVRDERTSGWTPIQATNCFVIDLTAHGLENLSLAELDAMFPYYIDYGTKSTVCAMRLKSVNEGETEETIQYIIGKDQGTGEILELRSLPNGIKDEISLTEGKLTKRVAMK